MKTKTLLFTLSAATLIAAGGLSAKAEGTWQYGYGIETAYSNYHHGSKTHSATVTNNNTGRQARDTQSPSVWAKAVVGRNIFEKCTFNFNYW